MPRRLMRPGNVAKKQALDGFQSEHGIDFVDKVSPSTGVFADYSCEKVRIPERALSSARVHKTVCDVSCQFMAKPTPIVKVLVKAQNLSARGQIPQPRVEW